MIYFDKISLGAEREPVSPVLMGRHFLSLGVAPEPRMAEILRAVYELQLHNVVTNLDEAIEVAKKIMANEEKAA